MFALFQLSYGLPGADLKKVNDRDGIYSTASIIKRRKVQGLICMKYFLSMRDGKGQMSVSS